MILAIVILCLFDSAQNSIGEKMEKKPKVIVFDLGMDKIVN